MTTHVEGEPMTEQEPTAAPSGSNGERSEPASGVPGHPATSESVQSHCGSCSQHERIAVLTETLVNARAHIAEMARFAQQAEDEQRIGRVTADAIIAELERQRDEARTRPPEPWALYLSDGTATTTEAAS